MVTRAIEDRCVELAMLIDNGNRTLEKKRPVPFRIISDNLVAVVPSMLHTGRGRIERSLIEIASRHPLEFTHEVSVTITSVIQVDANSNPLRILSIELSVGRGAADILRQYL